MIIFLLLTIGVLLGLDIFLCLVSIHSYSLSKDQINKVIEKLDGLGTDRMNETVEKLDRLAYSIERMRLIIETKIEPKINVLADLDDKTGQK